MALSREMKKAIAFAIFSEAISFTLLGLPFWIEEGNKQPILVSLGILGGFLNLPALIFWLFVALTIGWILDVAGIRFGEEMLTQNVFFTLVAVAQTAVWIRIWHKTFRRRHRSVKSLSPSQRDKIQ